MDYLSWIFCHPVLPSASVMPLVKQNAGSDNALILWGNF